MVDTTRVERLWPPLSLDCSVATVMVMGPPFFFFSPFVKLYYNKARQVGGFLESLVSHFMVLRLTCSLLTLALTDLLGGGLSVK